MLDIGQLRDFVVRPCLQQAGLWSLNAEQLIIGTALIESGLVYLAQTPTPIARGLWQMEQATYNDLRLRLLGGHKALAQKILDCLWMDNLPPTYDYLSGNLAAACIFARVKYWFSSDPLPKENDIKGMSKYWGKIYNTRNDELQMARFVALYNKHASQLPN